MKNFLINIFTYFFFLFIISPSLCQHSSFAIELEPNQELCLNEYYQLQTVIILEVTSEKKDILTTIKAPNGHIIFYNKNFTNIHSFTTNYNGYYNFCMKNENNMITEINVVIKSGVGVNDYSSIAKSKDLEPIDYELDKILKKEYILNHFNTISQEKQNMFSLLYTSISTKIIFYSILMMVGMILIGIIETLYLKRFMEKRKII